MKSIKIILVLMLLVILTVVAGCYKHYVDVYINAQCGLVAIDNDTSINPLVVFPGDYVIFNNISGGRVDIGFPEGWFEEDEVSIPKGKRKILKVIMMEPSESTMSINCEIGGSGDPKVVVGEEP